MKTTTLFVLLFTLIIAAAAALPAQIINVKTYPVLSDNSVLEIPSANAGMGRISFAVRDNLAEAYRNPAVFPEYKGITAFLVPRWSGWNVSQTGGTTYTQSGFNFSERRDALNAQLSAGVQARDGKQSFTLVTGYNRLRSSLSDQTSGNPAPVSSSFKADQYPLYISFGTTVVENVTIGASFNYLPLKGIDGIQFLYPNSRSVSVSGSIDEYRLGVAAVFGSSVLDIVAGRNIFAASHGASYEWSEPVQNRDENDNIFSQVTYSHRLSEKLSLAATFTGNWKELPKLPNYPIAGIPRDPGYTRAFNLGGGMSYAMNEATLFAFEYLYEPVAADTWVDALETRTVNGRTIIKGMRERENNYDFRNHIVRLGLQVQPEEWLTLQAGAEMHSYSYNYEMKDNINNITRQSSPENQWTETTLTGGAMTSFGGVQVGYNIDFITGRGILESMPMFWLENSRALSADFYLVPSSFLRVNPVNVVSHRMTVMYAL